MKKACILTILTFLVFYCSLTVNGKDLFAQETDDDHIAKKEWHKEIEKLPRVNLRSSYGNYTRDDINEMLKKYNFFDRCKNKTGDFANDYELREINGDKVVIDNATGIMWHWSDAENGKIATWTKAKQWINDLNKRGYAGYYDWRLPTVEEAASLLEPGKKSGDLYIGPVFDEKQKRIWTGDSKGPEWEWYVSFDFGIVDCCRFYNHSFYVRPVRTSKGNTARTQTYTAPAQTHPAIKGTITNIPPSYTKVVHLYSYYGNDLTKVGSAPVNEQGNFVFKLNQNIQQGLYKIGIDLENSASIVMSGKESIIVKADFEQLKSDNISVKDSRENQAYRAFLNEWKRFTGEVADLNYVSSQKSTVDPFYLRETRAITDKIRLLAHDCNEKLFRMSENYRGTFTSEILINLSLLPELAEDHNKDSYDSEKSFLHEYYFDYVNFADERIVYAPFLEEKYIAYLDKYTHHTVEGYKDSADFMMLESEVNNVVFEFTIQFLIDYFSENGLVELAEYIVDETKRLTKP